MSSTLSRTSRMLRAMAEHAPTADLRAQIDSAAASLAEDPDSHRVLIAILATGLSVYATPSDRRPDVA